MATQQSGFNLLRDEAKRKGYLLHEDLLNMLPSDFVDTDELIMTSEGTTDDDEEISDAIEALTTETRTTDPVRMYMREMGSVELLTREGEIAIAKRIEDGLRQIMSSLVQYPEAISSIIDEYHTIIANEGRISDLIIGFFDEEITATKPKSELKSETIAETEDTDNSEADVDTDDADTDSSDDFDDTGPDPVYTDEQIKILKDLHEKYIKAIDKQGRKAANTIKLQKKVIEQFSKFKLAIKPFLRQTMKLRNLLRETRDQERLIMRYVVGKAKVPRKHFIASFPGNEANFEWLDNFAKENADQAKALQTYRTEILRAQKKLLTIEEKSNLKIAEVKEVNRRVSIGEAKSRRAKKEMIETNLRLVISIRIPVHMIETINKLNRISRQIMQETGQEPTPEELGQLMEMPEDKIRKVLKIAKEPISMETPIGEDEDSNLGDFIEDSNTELPIDFATSSGLREATREVLSSLTPREAKVLRMRFGIDMNTDHTLEEVGKQFDVTRERIRQIEAKALRKLRHPSRAEKLQSFIDTDNE